MRPISYFLCNPYQIVASAAEKIKTYIPDKEYIKILFRSKMGYRLNLNNPKTLCEKLNWLKLYDRQPIYTQMVDKYLVKALVSDAIGARYVVQPLGIWNTVDEIEWDKLPDKYVIKCTHDSGSVCICRDNKNFDREAAKRKLQKGLNEDYFLGKREWPYKNVKRRILAEPYIDGLGTLDSIEYKLTCMNGEVKFVTVCGGIAHSAFENRTNDHFTKDWERLDWYVNYKPSGKDIKKPEFMNEMITLSEKLAAGIPYVRVDWYVLNGKMFFGEFTFYTWAGYMNFQPKEWDEILGSWLILPENK